MKFLGYTAMIRLDNVSATVTPSADRVIGSLAQADRGSCNADLQEKNTGKHRMVFNESCSEVGVRMNDLLWVKHITKIATLNQRPAYAAERSAQIIKEMKIQNIDFLGKSEMWWAKWGKFSSDEVSK